MLFGETPARIILSLAEPHWTALEALAKEHGVPCSVIGRTRAEDFILKIDGRELIAASVNELRAKWRGYLEEMLALPTITPAS
jgi:hypothetical protein